MKITIFLYPPYTYLVLSCIKGKETNFKEFFNHLPNCTDTGCDYFLFFQYIKHLLSVYTLQQNPSQTTPLPVDCVPQKSGFSWNKSFCSEKIGVVIVNLNNSPAILIRAASHHTLHNLGLHISQCRFLGCVCGETRQALSRILKEFIDLDRQKIICKTLNICFQSLA